MKRAGAYSLQQERRMKITLVCNTALPVIQEKFNLLKMKPESWLVGHVDSLRRKGFSVTVCFPLPEGNAPISDTVGDLRVESYTADADMTEYNAASEADFVRIFKKTEADIIHVFGTEMPHTLAAVHAAEQCGMLDRLVISIQGMVSVIGEHHYYAGLPTWMHHAKTFRDFVRRDSISKQRERFILRGHFEKAALQKAKHVIGRTDWDRACVTQINPDIRYHFCNETLRGAFYRNAWKREDCIEHSIFVSQSNYPVKGIHKMFEALAILKEKYPDVHLYTTGNDPRVHDGFKSRIRQDIYSKYLVDTMKKLGIDNHVTYLGYLDEEQMCAQYINAHVFASPSSIENSPNSLGEAMLLGVPSVSSDVGGVKNLMVHGKEGFTYPFDETYMLAYYVDRLFSSDPLAATLSENAKRRAAETHDKETNADKMLEIYRTIANEAGR